MPQPLSEKMISTLSLPDSSNQNMAHLAGPAVRKGVRDRIEKQIGQHLAIGPGITVHGEIGLALDIERQIVLSQSRPQAHDDLLGQVAEVEAAADPNNCWSAATCLKDWLSVRPRD